MITLAITSSAESVDYPGNGIIIEFDEDIDTLLSKFDFTTMLGDILLILVFIGVWLALQVWILPRLGVPT